MKTKNRASNNKAISSRETKAFGKEYQKEFDGRKHIINETLNNPGHAAARSQANLTGAGADKSSYLDNLAKARHEELVESGLARNYKNPFEHAPTDTVGYRKWDTPVGASPQSEVAVAQENMLNQGKHLVDSGQYQNAANAQAAQQTAQQVRQGIAPELNVAKNAAIATGTSAGTMAALKGIADGPPVPQSGVVTKPGFLSKVGSGIKTAGGWLYDKAGVAAGALKNAAGAAGNWILQNPGTAAGIGAGALAIGGLAYYLNKRRKLKQAGLLPGGGFRGFENKKEWLKFKVAEATETGKEKEAQKWGKQLNKLEMVKAFSDYKEKSFANRLYSDLCVCRYYGEINRPQYSIYSNSDGSITIYDREFGEEIDIVSNPNLSDKFFSAVESAREYGGIETEGYAFYSDKDGNVSIYDKGYAEVVGVVGGNKINDKFFSVVEMARQYGRVETPQIAVYSDDIGNVAIVYGDDEDVDVIDAEDRGFKVKCFSRREN